jgi:hypothetical protein
VLPNDEKRSLLSRKGTSMTSSSLDMSVEEGVQCRIGDEDGGRAHEVVVLVVVEGKAFGLGWLREELDRDCGWRLTRNWAQWKGFQRANWGRWRTVFYSRARAAKWR